MEECLAGLRDETSQPYLDGNLVHSKSFEDHLHDLREVLRQNGLGAVLYQRQQGKLVVIGYGSRTLTAPEINDHHHSGKLEFIAMKWALL